MPNLLPQRSKFDEEAAKLAAWLGAQPNAAVTPLPPAAVAVYGGMFVQGWSCQLPIAVGTTREFHVLLNRDYPFVAPRVGMVTRDRYMHWPHVEPRGLLCLTKQVDAFTEPLVAAAEAINNAMYLVNRCETDPAFVRSELEREFQTYWNRSTGDSAHIHSILNAGNPAVRQIAICHSKDLLIAAETEADAKRWLTNLQEPVRGTYKGVFGHLARPPIFPLPKTAAEATSLIREKAPDALALLEQLPPLGTTYCIFSAEVENMRALVGLSLFGQLPATGFRPRANYSAPVRRFLRAQSQLALREVERADGAWVHGRGVNRDYPMLKDMTVAILGCGSVGSQTAMRLAQCGIGHLLLVDSEFLNAANVGRHALGMDSLNKGKARELAHQISMRFPHCEAVAYPKKWEDLDPQEWQRVKGAHLIVSAIGDFAAESSLNEWHVKSAHPQPIIFGWLDPQGLASHAVALFAPRPCQNCLLDDAGRLLTPEFELKDNGADLREPGCGTEFQSYGALDVAGAEILICDVAIGVLTATITEPHHRIRASSTARLKSLGGTWTAAHDAIRPKDFSGVFEFERPMVARANCPICS